jgi:hypothetical protein
MEIGGRSLGSNGDALRGEELVDEKRLGKDAPGIWSHCTEC